ncbi:hypothetical protein KKE92_02350 [Candidatus Micrarchaeota archaeon]|nr:hypothetical protein [Candidatus Micrarchaeota archaeon]MBU1681685.1 hypothetical protein [Candidatus Micrarchaeota archaeon]
MEQLLSLPKEGTYKYEQLAYVESTDDMISKTYGFLAFKETNASSGDWRVRVTATVTTGIMMDPKMMIKKSEETERSGKEFFVWGSSLKPREGSNDSRLVETMIFQKEGKPTHVELHLITRNADGSPKEEKVMKFDWPQ